MKKKYLYRLTAVFFVLLLLFTFLSMSVYNARLPVVTTNQTKQAAIVQNTSVKGELFYLNAEKVFINSDFVILEVFAKKGMTVFEGQALFSVDISQVELEKQSLELELLRIDNSIFALGWEDVMTAASRQTIRMKEQEFALQRDIILKKIELITASYPSDGIVIANKNGMVDRVYIEAGDRISEGMPCLEMYPQDAALSVRFAISQQQAEYFQSLNGVTVTFQSIFLEGETNRQVFITETMHAYGHQKEFSDKSGQLEFISQLPTPKGTPLLEGEVEVSLVAGNTDAYPYVVPVSCVHTDQEGTYVFLLQERRGIFGIETYIRRVSVSVIARNASYVAIDSKEIIAHQQIVATTTLPLYTNDTVLVQSP